VALKKFAVNIAALTAGRVLQSVSAFIAIPILARLLDPAEFGLVAMASAFVVFAMAISDAGLGQTLVRVDPRDRLVWSSAFWLISGIGLVLTLIIVALAVPSAWLLQEPRLVPVILALAPLPLMQALMAPISADLQQREQFRHIAGAELICSIAGTAVAIGLALAGAGVWALVWQQLTVWILRFAILGFFTKFRPRFEFKLSVLGQHIRFSRDTAILGLVVSVSRQADPLIIGRMLGAAPVGLYSVALSIANLPAQFVSIPLVNALYTRMVMVRDDPSAGRNIMLIACWMIAAISFPALAVVAAAADAYFHTFLSEKWLPAAPVFALIAPAFAMQAVGIVFGNVLLALGETGRRLRLSLVFIVSWLLVLPFVASQGLAFVAGGFTVLYFIVSIYTYPRYLKPLQCSAVEFIANISVPIGVALAAAATHLSLNAAWPMPPLAEIGVSIGVMAAAYALLALLEWPKIMPRITALRGILAASAPGTDGAEQPA